MSYTRIDIVSKLKSDIKASLVMSYVYLWWAWLVYVSTLVGWWLV